MYYCITHIKPKIYPDYDYDRTYIFKCDYLPTIETIIYSFGLDIKKDDGTIITELGNKFIPNLGTHHIPFIR